jgi:tetratricopeptide (TPR) repeat protein
MGTPGYMAPEQARGEGVNARADVFALGATLAAILTGQPAFVGSSVSDTVQKAAAADLGDVFARLDSCGADTELVAIAKRCLSADRDHRPADGQAVATEVGAYRAGVEARLRQAETERAEAVVREGEQRKRRQVQAWAGGIVVGVLLLGVIGTSIGLVIANEARKAESAQRVATQTAKDEILTTAEVMANAVSSTLPEEGEVERSQFVLLGSAHVIFQRIAAESGDDERTLWRTANANLSSGAIARRMKLLAESDTALRTALHKLARLCTDFPNNPEYHHGLAQVHTQLGWVLSDQGRPEEAEGELQTALTVRERIATTFPDEPKNPFNREQLVHARRILGKFYSDFGLPIEAEEQHRLALTELRQLSIGYPHVPGFRLWVAECHADLGASLADQGRRVEAEEQYGKAIAMLEQMTTKSPASDWHAVKLGRVYNRFGEFVLADGNQAGCVEWCDKSIRTLAPVLERNPADKVARRLLRDSHQLRATANHQANKPVEALQDWDKAIKSSPINEQAGLRVTRAITLLNTGKVVEAAREIAELTGPYRLEPRRMVQRRTLPRPCQWVVG